MNIGVIVLCSFQAIFLISQLIALYALVRFVLHIHNGGKKQKHAVNSHYGISENTNAIEPPRRSIGVAKIIDFIIAKQTTNDNRKCNEQSAPIKSIISETISQKESQNDCAYT